MTNQQKDQITALRSQRFGYATIAKAVGLKKDTVVHGDTLWKIAAQYLGDGSRYKEIVSLNGLTSNVIYSGMKLKIPN